MIKGKGRCDYKRGWGNPFTAVISNFGKNVRSILFIFIKNSTVATSGTEVKAAQIHYCHLLITDPLMIIFINCPPTKAWSKRDQHNEVIKEKYVYIQDATIHMENKIFCGLGLPSFGGGHNGHDISKEERNRCNTPSFFIPFSKGKL